MKKVTVITARTLSKQLLEILQKGIAKKYGKDVEYDLQVNPAVIGGIKVVVGSQAVDMTVAGQLSQVKKQVLAKM
ncbi:MAG: hypothetical protein COU63_00490 [Candidatus Pacebacteria bacterium CG10_big_fil_rev_8_21_14_0_10_36_11]|nr:F0F1 ATP synthase subunit delta [Candidatus Pacearchaeota archaeon]OIP74508.1 MAG: hypothetical protein AUK08_00085 [Candidatus Pacebacteria bacterium CG2_30_36_39]PIR65134.1 MAG: hypothetical protein COU63_00490 [Candidatus Pacebacteria bacterium CG10_big_fil_rev_8_21_14_0_10_36_11]PJC42615.1 MAG: hypothetical protein CO040_03520 [Candidatus Pacebacteria bacterium CG_4_9_14_0_2_um_filter_36_8]